MTSRNSWRRIQMELLFSHTASELELIVTLFQNSGELNPAMRRRTQPIVVTVGNRTVLISGGFLIVKIRELPFGRSLIIRQVNIRFSRGLAIVMDVVDA